MTEQPEYHQHEEFRNRRKKLDEIRSLGIEPYPQRYERQHKAHELIAAFQDKPVGNSEEAAEGKTEKVCVGGRLVLFRAMGKNIFAQLQDDSGRIQVMFNRDHTKLEGFNAENSEGLTALKFLEKKVDLGDILGVEGYLFRTHVGELTIFATKATLLCKTLLPLPDKHSGLTDKELRYRKRWLDLISNPDISKTFHNRTRIFRIIRKYFEDFHFSEVETPVLQNIYGGAQAKPFTSTVNALDHQQVFLRISLEIPLKKLIVGGMDRVYEIGKVFRNEGIDKNHNPEFTLLEAYASYWDYNDMMKFVEDLYEKIALELFGKTQIPYPHPKTGEIVEIELKAPWKRLKMVDSLLEYAGLDVKTMETEAIRSLLKKESDIDAKKLATAPRGALIAMLFEEKVEQYLIQPHHIIDHPIETTPLCKLHRDPEERKAGIVERFESFILTHEMCNAYTELNDPVLQRELLLDQANRKDAGDEEANPLDEDFIEAICQGMPPTGGVGIGLDRLVMLFTEALSIRDVLYFPMMKPLD
jgi:lysyl-tRNA synthetase class 2